MSFVDALYQFPAPTPVPIRSAPSTINTVQHIISLPPFICAFCAKSWRLFRHSQCHHSYHFTLPALMRVCMVTRHRSRRSASASRTPASTSPLALGPAEDWTTIQDPGLRRRLQNRLAQRRYRQRLAEAANVGECPAPATRLHSTSLPLDIQMPVEYDHIVAGFYAGLAQVDSSSGHDDFPLFDAWAYSEPASYPGGLQQSHLVGNVYNPAGTGRFYTEAEYHHTSQPVNQDWGTMVMSPGEHSSSLPI